MARYYFLEQNGSPIIRNEHAANVNFGVKPAYPLKLSG
jgi:hypothetical protein